MFWLLQQDMEGKLDVAGDAGEGGEGGEGVDSSSGRPTQCEFCGKVVPAEQAGRICDLCYQAQDQQWALIEQERKDHELALELTAHDDEQEEEAETDEEDEGMSDEEDNPDWVDSDTEYVPEDDDEAD
jgi:hypothetical protein